MTYLALFVFAGLAALVAGQDPYIGNIPFPAEVIAGHFPALPYLAEHMLKNNATRECCAVDIVIVIDITDGVGFTRDDCEAHIRKFLLALLDQASPKGFDLVHFAIVEYGSLGRIAFDFRSYTTRAALRKVFAKYTPGASLGFYSNAEAGFTGAATLLKDTALGHRLEAASFVFWLVHSTPQDVSRVQQYVNARIKPRAYLVVVGVGYNLVYKTVKQAATSKNYAFWVAEITLLQEECSGFYFDYCPAKPSTTLPPTTIAAVTATQPPRKTEPKTTTTTTTTTKPTTTTTTTKKPATTTTTTQPPRKTEPTTTKPTTTTTTTTTKKPTTTTTTTTTTKPTTTTTTTKKPATTTTTTKPPRQTPTTTTTTKRTTTTTTTTKRPSTLPNPADDVCHDCRQRRNQKDHYADPDNCHGFIQCFYYNETYAVSIRRVCPVGTYWHDEILQCAPEGSIPCTDVCQSNDAVAAKGCYAGQGCRQFFVCANTASYGMCCPEGTTFVEAACSCEESVTCLDSCSQIGAPVATTVRPASQLNATVCVDSFGSVIAVSPAESNAYYLLDIEGQASEKLYCAYGTAFDLQTCRCNTETDVTLPPLIPTRQAILWLPFDEDALDHSHHHFATFLYDGAEVTSGAFAFGGSSFSGNGAGHLEVPGLKTYDFGTQASFCAHFRCESGNGYRCDSNGGIFSNNRNEDKSAYTVIMATQPSNQLSGLLNFWHPIGSQQITVGLTQQATALPTGWNQACIVYTGNAFELFINGVLATSQNVGGGLAIAHCPLSVGHDQFFGYFNGHIDNVLFTGFAMSQDEITAHYRGDFDYLRQKGFF